MRILEKYDLFIFDWDNTLTTSTLVVRVTQLVNKWRKGKRARKVRDFERKKVLEGITISEDFSKLYSLLDDVYSVFSKPVLKKSTVELLKFLKKNKKKVAIFSDSKTYRLFKETRELGVLRYFDYVLTAESIKRYKPNPAGLFLLLDKSKTKEARSIYIGDMASDVSTAKYAGMDSLAVSDGVDSHSELAAAKPSYLFRSLDEFLKAFKKQ